VTFPVTASGPLFVGVFDQNAGVMRSVRVASPTSPAAFTITGIPAGNYVHFAILDQDGDGAIDGGDVANVKSGGPQGTIAVSADMTHDLVLSGANGEARVSTQHQIWQGQAGSDWYGIETEVRGQVKQPVRAVLYSAPGIAVPADVGGFHGGYAFFADQGATRPTVGDAYRYKVWYSDGSTELLSGSVAVVLDTFATGLAVNSALPYSKGQPMFTWTNPASPPAGYGLQLSLWGDGASWYYPRNDPMPAGTTSVRYDVDGSATPSSLAAGVAYTWTVVIQDPARNQASVHASYSY
jgi:hypothetical protein